ncbi:hypothetical protein D3C73_1016600 [compost metagenome]
MGSANRLRKRASKVDRSSSGLGMPLRGAGAAGAWGMGMRRLLGSGSPETLHLIATFRRIAGTSEAALQWLRRRATPDRLMQKLVIGIRVGSFSCRSLRDASVVAWF